MFFKYAVSQDIQDWIFDSFVWAIDQNILNIDTKLIFPSKESFKAPKGQDIDTAKALVNDLKSILNIQDEDIELVPMNALPDEYTHEYGALSDVAGTWQNDANQALISYNPNLMKTPMAFISMLAHELMHHVLHMRISLPPGGEEVEELSTDLHVITSGLGIIQMIGAEQSGWQGYMSQPSRAHALALFMAINDISMEEVTPALPPISIKFLKKSVKHIQKYPEQVEELKKMLNDAVDVK